MPSAPRTRLWRAFFKACASPWAAACAISNPEPWPPEERLCLVPIAVPRNDGPASAAALLNDLAFAGRPAILHSPRLFPAPGSALIQPAGARRQEPLGG